MNIIFNELEYAENLLENGFQDYLSWGDLKILSSYFRHNGLKNPQIKNSIIEFHKRFADYNESIVGAKLDNAITKSEKYILRISSLVAITESEIANIRALKNYKLEKVCFIMLVISRSNRIAFKSQSPRYYLNKNFSEILLEAKVHASKTERDKIKYELFKLGMICAPTPNKMAEYNNHGEMFELLFVDEDSLDAIIVNNLYDIISFYKQKCIQCGKDMEIGQSRKREICSECYEIERKKNESERLKTLYLQSKMK